MKLFKYSLLGIIACSPILTIVSCGVQTDWNAKLSWTLTLNNIVNIHKDNDKLFQQTVNAMYDNASNNNNGLQGVSIVLLFNTQTLNTINIDFTNKNELNNLKTYTNTPLLTYLNDNGFTISSSTKSHSASLVVKNQQTTTILKFKEMLQILVTCKTPLAYYAGKVPLNSVINKGKTGAWGYVPKLF